MIHEEIIIRPDGTQYEVIVFLSRFGFCFFVSRKRKNRSCWVQCDKTELTPEEIYKAKLTLWEQMKPEL